MPWLLWSSARPDEVRTHLHGHAFTPRALLWGDAGLRAWLARGGAPDPADWEGRFALTVREGDAVTVSADPFGLQPLWWWSDGPRWAVSSSFAALCDELVRLGAPLRLHVPAARAFLLERQGLFGGQLLGRRTLVDGVWSLPVGARLRIAGGRVTARPGPPVVAPAPSAEARLEAIRAFLAATRVRMRAAARSFEGRAFVDLSGGQDSRILFGLAVTDPELAARLPARSQRDAQDDWPVASALADSLGHPLRPPPPLRGAPPDGAEAFALWLAGNAGVYLGAGPPRGREAQDVLRVHGGTVATTVGVRRSPDWLLRWWSRALAPSHVADLRDELGDALSAAPEPFPGAPMALHYARQYARFHYGRAWFVDLGWSTVTPLLCREFERAWHLTLAAGLDKNDLVRDVLAALDPRLALHPFDAANPTFSPEAVAASPGLGLAVPPAPDLEVLGELPDPAPGPRPGGPAFEEVAGAAFAAARAAAEGVFPADYVAAADRERAAGRWRKALAVISVARIRDPVTPAAAAPRTA